MAVSLWTTQAGDHNVMTEEGGIFRVSTLGAATHTLTAVTRGNYDLVTLGGTVVAVVGDANPGAPYVQLFAYGGGNNNVCHLSGGVSTFVAT